jgi:hypothetical protein
MGIAGKWIMAAGIALASLPGCVQGDDAANKDAEVFDPGYLGINTALLDGDLVNFRVAMTGARGNKDVEDYARCAAAQYALIRGTGFVRHVRTIVNKSGGAWRGDAVYVISAALPRGNLTIDAEVVVSDCAANAIPTV